MVKNGKYFTFYFTFFLYNYTVPHPQDLESFQIYTSFIKKLINKKKKTIKISGSIFKKVFA